jgi:hypothetical protein
VTEPIRWLWAWLWLHWYLPVIICGIWCLVDGYYAAKRRRQTEELLRG